MSQHIQAIIQSNLDLLYDGGYKEQYTNLGKLFVKSSTLDVHLARMLEWMKDRPDPFERDSNGNEYWTMPIPELIKAHGSSPITWQSHSVLIRLMGFLKYAVPNKNSTLPRMQQEYQQAVQAHKHVMIFYSPVEFTPDVLAHADDIAATIINSTMAVGHIAKTDIIRHFGQTKANQLYADFRTQSELESNVVDLMTETIVDHIAAKGYTLPEDVKLDVEHKIFDGELEGQDITKAYRIIKKYMNRKRDLCFLAGCVYRQQTKADHERFGTTTNCWIIAAAMDDEAEE